MMPIEIKSAGFKEKVMEITELLKSYGEMLVEGVELLHFWERISTSLFTRIFDLSHPIFSAFSGFVNHIVTQFTCAVLCRDGTLFFVGYKTIMSNTV